MKEKISITLSKKTIAAADSIIDRLYIRNRSQAIESLIEKAFGENKIAVILAGGDGKKLRISNTEYRPTAKIRNISVIELAIRKLRENKFKQIYIVARQLVLKEIFEILGNGSKYRIKIEYIEEQNAKGTADSLRLLRGKIKSSFLVMWSDLIIEKMNLNNLWESHLKRNALATLAVTADKSILEKAGVIKIQGEKIIEYKEKPKRAESSIFFAGVFIAEPEIFEYPGKSLEKEVFPALVKKDLVFGYMDGAPYLHFHTKKEILRIKSQVQSLI